MKTKWLYVLICASVLFSLAVTPAFAAPAVDGDGLVTVSPTSVTYGACTGSFTFTFTANNDFASGSQVVITVPAGWTAPTTAAGAGHVSWFPGPSCTLSGAPPVAITGMDIFIDIASCTAGNSFTVTYANVTPGPVSLTPYTFVAQTDIGPGGAGLVPTTAPAPTISVDPKTLTVTGITANAKVYNGATSAALNFSAASLVGVLSGDLGNVNLVTSGYTADFNTQHIGTAKPVTISGLTLSGTKAGNYVLTQPVSSGSITKRAVTITAATDTKTYDGATSSSGLPSLTSGTLAPGDTATWTQTFNNKNVGAGNKVLTPTGLVSDGNSGLDYSYTYATISTGTINKRSITVNAETDTKTYNGNTSSAGVPLLLSGTIAIGDTVTWTQTFDNKNIGTSKVLTPAGLVSDGNSGNNYVYTYTQDTTGTITAKPLTVSAAGLTPANKIYNGTTNTTLTPGSPSLVGVISPDVVTLLGAGTATGVFADRNAGTSKTVNISGLTLGGAGVGNYTLTQPTRTANITKKPITVNAVTATKTYDGTATSSGVPTLSVSTPLAAGDSAPAWMQTFNNKNAGTSKVLTPAGLVNDGNSGLNYAYTYATVSTGAINKLSITVTAVSDSKAYDGLVTSSGLPLLSGTTPLAAGDTEPVWSQTFANKNAGTGKTINPSGLVNDSNGGNNYAYNFVPDVGGVITARAITVTALPDTKTYNGTTASSVTPNINPALVGTDTSGFIQTFDSPDAGSNKTLTPSGTVNDGNSGLNYAITFAAPITTGVINKANPTLSVTNSPVLYNGLPQSAIVSAGTVAGSVSNILYNGSATMPTNAGNYAVLADFTSSNSNYNNLVAASAGKFVIRKERTFNGGFNTYVGPSKIPKSWSATNFAATDGKDITTKKEGTASVKIMGLVGKTKTLTQTLTLSGVSGDLFTFSFWAKGAAIPAAGICRAQVLLYNGTTLNATKTISCNSGIYGFQKKTLNFTATATYNKVVIVFTYAKTSGTIWFDGVSLIR